MSHASQVVREYEDPKYHRCFTGHTGSITSIDWCPSAPSASSSYQFVSGSTDHSLIIWQYQPQLLAWRLLGHTASINKVKYNRAATTIASASEDGTVRLWQQPPDSSHSSASSPHSASSVIRVTEEHQQRSLGDSIGVTDVDWSPADDWLCTADRRDRIQLFSHDEAEGWRHTASLFGHLDHVTASRFSVDGRIVCSSSMDGTVRIWDMETLRCLHRYDQFHCGLVTLSLHHAGNILAVATETGFIDIIDIRSHQLMQHYSTIPATSVHSNNGGPPISSLVYHPNGRYLFSGGDDGLVSITDVSRGELCWSIGGHAVGSSITALACRDEGDRWLTGASDQRINSWTFQAKTSKAQQHKQAKERLYRQRHTTAAPTSSSSSSSSPSSSAAAAPSSLAAGASIMSPEWVSQKPGSRSRSQGNSSANAAGPAVGSKSQRPFVHDARVPRRPSSSDGVTPLLHHNHSAVLPSHHYHATPVDDEVARLGDDLSGTIGFISQQLGKIQQTMQSMQDRLSACEHAVSQLDSAQQQIS